MGAADDVRGEPVKFRPEYRTFFLEDRTLVKERVYMSGENGFSVGERVWHVEAKDIDADGSFSLDKIVWDTADHIL